MEYRYTAIVLKKQEVGETDRLYTFYTQEHGKIRAIAKGIRKPEAKLASQLENGTFCDVSIARTRGTGKIVGALAEESYPHIRVQLSVLQSLLFTLHRFERLVHFEESDTNLFRLLSEFLFLLELSAKNEESETHRLLVCAFLLQVINQLGYAMEARVSAVSGASFHKEHRFVFCPAHGGVIFEHERGGAEALPIHQNSVKLLRVFQEHSLKTVMKIRTSVDELREIERVVQYLFEWVV